jgi:hypothetical protein
LSPYICCSTSISGIDRQWSPASYSEVRRKDDTPPDDHKDLPEYLDHPPPGYEDTPPEDTPEPPKEEKSEEPTESWDGYHGHDVYPEVIYDHDPHHDEVVTTPAPPPPAPEVPHLQFGKLINRKLILVNLYFAIFFIAYCIFLMLRSVARKEVCKYGCEKEVTIIEIERIFWFFFSG